MWQISITSSYSATNSTTTFYLNTIYVDTATNGICCVIILSLVIKITTTNGIHSTHGILLLFIWVTNNNFIMLDIFHGLSQDTTSKS